jgi:hypothetical protein
MWLRKTAWHRLGLRLAGVSVLCCSPVVCSPIVYSPTVVSAAKAVPDKDQNNKDQNKRAAKPLVVRWDEEQPGCTFTRGDDGKYRWGLWSGDVAITLAVDAREVQAIRHRRWPILAVFLTIRYRGADSLDVFPEGTTLQFMKHFKVVKPALDPDSYTQKIQSDADAADDETRREVAKHPEKKQEQDARLQDYQKSVNEMIEFLSHNSLHPARLDRATPEVSGWVFFDTKSKWLGNWKTQEEFILRLPLAGKVFEFPFKLPPKKGELLLPKRE